MEKIVGNSWESDEISDLERDAINAVLGAQRIHLARRLAAAASAAADAQLAGACSADKAPVDALAGREWRGAEQSEAETSALTAVWNAYAIDAARALGVVATADAGESPAFAGIYARNRLPIESQSSVNRGDRQFN